jgi:hypothetical protein
MVLVDDGDDDVEMLMNCKSLAMTWHVVLLLPSRLSVVAGELSVSLRFPDEAQSKSRVPWLAESLTLSWVEMLLCKI